MKHALNLGIVLLAVIIFVGCEKKATNNMSQSSPTKGMKTVDNGDTVELRSLVVSKDSTIVMTIIRSDGGDYHIDYHYEVPNGTDIESFYVYDDSVDVTYDSDSNAYTYTLRPGAHVWIIPFDNPEVDNFAMTGDDPSNAVVLKCLCGGDPTPCDIKHDGQRSPPNWCVLKADQNCTQGCKMNKSGGSVVYPGAAVMIEYASVTFN